MSADRREATRRLFHSTNASAAEVILATGFRDREGHYGLVSFMLRGVFLSDQALGVNEGAAEEVLLEVRIPDNVDLSPFEIVGEVGGYREWCVPASLINERAEVRWVDGEEEDELRRPALPPQALPRPLPPLGWVHSDLLEPQ